MKTFKQYLTESEQTYSYKIKIAGGCDADKLKEIENAMGKYDIIKMSDPKTTPVMEDPLDFPGIKNIEVCIFEVELNYPASQVELVQMIEMISRQPAKHIKITSPAFAKSYEDNEGAEPEEGPLLEKDYEGETAEQKDAKDKYANPEKNIENPGDAKFEIAGGSTPKAETTNDAPMGDKSPVGSTVNEKPDVKSSAR